MKGWWNEPARHSLAARGIAFKPGPRPTSNVLQVCNARVDYTLGKIGQAKAIIGTLPEGGPEARRIVADIMKDINFVAPACTILPIDHDHFSKFASIALWLNNYAKTGSLDGENPSDNSEVAYYLEGLKFEFESALRWRDTSTSSRGILSRMFPPPQESSERYHNIHVGETVRMGRNYRRLGETDREEMEYGAGPAIREMSGYEDRDYTGRFKYIPKSGNRDNIKMREQKLWDIFWNAYEGS